MKLSRLLLGLLIFSGVFSCIHSPTNTWRTLDGRALSTDSIDATVNRLITAHDVTGMAVALISDGQVRHLKGYGFRMLEKNLPLEPNTIIYGASLTKSTFAYYVMQLVDEGVVDLDRPIGEYLPKPLPDYEEYSDLKGDERWRELTFRLLLSHRSGFANWRFLPQEGGYDENGKLEFFLNPGERYAYSGEGFELAQHVLEEGLGIDVGTQMQNRIFDRFDMNKTSMTWREDFLENYSHNYSMSGENLRHNTRNRVGVGGSMDTTAADWSQFLAAVVRGDVLSASSKNQMLSTQTRIRTPAQFPTLTEETTGEYDDITLSYGLGWGVFETPFGRAFFKEGHDDGTANYALCVASLKQCILLMSNSVRAEGIFKEVVDTLLGDVNLPWRWEGYIPYDLEKN
ncbi:MAG: serine hydrolase domain-containing protein [Gammaproteobacteria bacterium]